MHDVQNYIMYTYAALDIYILDSVYRWPSSNMILPGNIILHKMHKILPRFVVLISQTEHLLLR